MPELTRRHVAWAIASMIGLLAIGTGLYGLVSGPPKANPQRPSVSTSVSRDGTSPAIRQESDPSKEALARTSDPVLYARSVAVALFTWDTASGYTPADYQAPVVADADPSGEETAGLVADAATYMPTLDQWLNLATMKVAETLTINSALVPAEWTSIVAQAHGQLRPGTVAVTITADRHRTGMWDGQPAAESFPVSFTVFVACAPTFPRCHLLRLSEIDNPLR